MAQQSQPQPPSEVETSPFCAEAHFRAEYKLLTDFLVSVPRIKSEKVGKFISDAETPSPIDLTTYVINFES